MVSWLSLVVESATVSANRERKQKKQKNLNSRVHFLNFIYEEQLSPTAVFDFVGERRGLRDAHMASSVMTPTAPLCLAGFNGSGTRASL